ncbi:zf-HC2 domain-containing protein [Nocardioides sp.]|uniref:anti-sigma factor family protein n=1 Tax=Nocardioides sp. TaxID=35761 RepID=UPI00286ABD29|nr:zf-HC2 domain-containing protein [Nocardioides sp.]
MTDHEQLRISLGAYVLGGLADAEAADVEAHLVTCAECRDELAELVPPARVLAELRSAAPTEVPAAPAGLQDRVVTAVAAERDRERRTKWRRQAGLAAVGGIAAAVVLVVLVVGLVATRPDPAPTVPTEDVSVAVGVAGVRADADLVDHTWGVEVKLTASGFDEGRRYVVTVLGTDGRRYPAGGFVGTGEREMLCNLNSTVLRAAAAGFEVRDRRGRVVVSSTFTAV